MLLLEPTQFSPLAPVLVLRPLLVQELELPASVLPP